MAEGQMLKYFSEECLLNISSFLLGSPQKVRLHHNKALRRIQKKFRIEDGIKETFNTYRNGKHFDDTKITLKNTGFSIQEGLNNLKQQLNLIKSHMDYTYNHLGYNIYIYRSRKVSYDVGYVIVKNDGKIVLDDKGMEKSFKRRLKDLPRQLEQCCFKRIIKVEIAICKS